MCSSTSTLEKANTVNPGVPCRGCTADCIYISKCEGKPWRMTNSTVLTLLEKAKTVNQSR
jgi:hypothetical protein